MNTTPPNNDVSASASGMGVTGRAKKGMIAQGPVVIPVSGLVVFESRDTCSSSGPLKDDCSKFYMVLAGHARWRCGDRCYMLGPNTLCHIPAGQIRYHEALFKEPLLAYALHYRPELLPSAIASRLNALGIVSQDISSTAIQQVRAVRVLFQEMLFEQDARREGWELVLQSRLMDLVVRVLRWARRRSRNELPAFEQGEDSAARMARYILKLKSEFFRQETIAEVAGSVQLSRRRFTELFRQATGQSWRQYVLELRLKRAAELLAETDRSVSAAAFESGFEDLANFHHGFKIKYGLSPLNYRKQHRVQLSADKGYPDTKTHADTTADGFKFRGIKGWGWTLEQYMEEIPVLPSMKLNFLMSDFQTVCENKPDQPWCDEWWKPMAEAKRESFKRIIRACRENGITFCFAMHLQVNSERPLVLGSDEDLGLFYQHYSWAQAEGVQWFSVCMDDTGWGQIGPGACGTAHAALVNALYDRLQAEDGKAQIIFCSAAPSGDGINLGHRAYLDALACQMHPEVYMFWNGDSVVTPRISRLAAESYKGVVRHRLFLWDNYPVNDGSETLHLGALTGRDPDLCQIIDGYLCNPMRSQNQINRIPLATCADYASNPRSYNPVRSISSAIVRLGKTSEQQQVLKDLVEAYPGFLATGGGTGANPVRLKFSNFLALEKQSSVTEEFIRRMETILFSLNKLFPNQFPATKQTVLNDIHWMKRQVA